MLYRCSVPSDPVTLTYPKAAEADAEPIAGTVAQGDRGTPASSPEPAPGLEAAEHGSSPALWLMVAYGFVAGLPLPLSGFTFRLWLSEGGVSLAVIGLTANIGLAYSLKFLWAPVLDNAAPPGPLRHLGRRRGWLAVIQPTLAVAAALLA